MNAKRSRPLTGAAAPPPADPPLPSWFRIDEMEPIWQINLRLLYALTTYNGKSPATLPATFPPDVMAGLNGLGDRGRERLAHIPCLLVDGAFHHAQQWEDAKQGIHKGLITGASGGWSACAAGLGLARSTLQLAWYWTRTHQSAAPLVLNASPACADVISMLDPLILNRLAETCCGWFRPRWESQPHVWRSLSALAHEEPASALFCADPKSLDILFSELTEKLRRKQ